MNSQVALLVAPLVAIRHLRLPFAAALAGAPVGAGRRTVGRGATRVPHPAGDIEVAFDTPGWRFSATFTPSGVDIGF